MPSTSPNLFAPSIVMNPLVESITTVAPLGITLIVNSSEKPLIFNTSMYSSAVMLSLHGDHLFPAASNFASCTSCHVSVTVSLNQYPLNVNSALYLVPVMVLLSVLPVMYALNFLSYPSSVKMTPFCNMALKSLTYLCISFLVCPLK